MSKKSDANKADKNVNISKAHKLDHVVNNSDNSLNLKQIIIKAIIVLVVSVVCGLLGEVFFNLKVLRLSDVEKGKQDFDLSTIRTEGFELKDGKLTMTKMPAMISVDRSVSYLSKLEIDYTFDRDFTATVRLFNSQAAVDAMTPAYVRDANNKGFGMTEIVIDNSVQYVDVIFDDNAMGITIDSVAYDNEFNLSGRRMLCVMIFVAMAMFLILFHKLLATRLEVVFAFLATGLCVAMVFTFPTQKVSWDEANHFYYAYHLGFGDEIVSTPELRYYSSDDAVSTLFYPKSEDEYEALEDFLRGSKIYDEGAEGNQVVKTSFSKLSSVGHIPSNIGIRIGRLFKMPFSTLYYMGKLFNALVYIWVTYLALKKLTIGRRIMTVMALMPTTLFLASSYSYDATVNAFVFLGLATFFAEYGDRERYMSWKNYIIFLVSVAIASAVKMVYAPLLLLLLIMPKDKFKDKKTLILMKYGIFILCFVILAVMIVPMLINPSVRGDSRGGATNAGGQLSHILGNPVGYASLLLKSIAYTAPSFLLGDGIFGTMAHFTAVRFSNITTMLLIFVVFTDTPSFKLGKKARVIMAGVCFVIICFVWTAMYISFTPVGHVAINGVQGRYFIPILFPLLLVLNSDKFKNEMPDKVYNLIIVLVPVLLSFSAIGYNAIRGCV